MIFATWNCFTIPITVAFEPGVAETIYFFLFNSFIDIVFLLDIFVQFRTSFLHPRTGEEIILPHLIGWEYFKSRFLIDVLATIPFDTFGSFFVSGGSTSTYILQIFGILKLI